MTTECRTEEKAQEIHIFVGLSERTNVEMAVTKLQV